MDTEVKQRKNTFWPAITDLTTAQKASAYGFYANIWIACTNAFFYLLYISKGDTGIFIVSEYDWIISILFAVFAWGTRKPSRTFIIISFACYLVFKTALFIESPGTAFKVTALIAIWLYINGIRGAFTYHAIRKTSLNPVTGSVTEPVVTPVMDNSINTSDISSEIESINTTEPKRKIDKKRLKMLIIIWASAVTLGFGIAASYNLVLFLKSKEACILYPASYFRDTTGIIDHSRAKELRQMYSEIYLDCIGERRNYRFYAALFGIIALVPWVIYFGSVFVYSAIKWHYNFLYPVK